MFSKAARKIKVEKKKVAAIRNSSLYNGWNISGSARSRPGYVILNRICYDIEPVMKYVIDDYDSYIGSVELSHYEYAGYNLIERYDNYEDKTELDFRFAELQDVINLKLGEEIQSIIIKSSNLRYASFSGEQPINFNIDVDTDLIETVNNLRIFISKHKDMINSINFSNVPNKSTQLLLQMICSVGEQYTITFEELAVSQELIDLQAEKKIEKYRLLSSELDICNFSSAEPCDFYIDVDTDLLDTIYYLIVFIKKNKYSINSINFVNVSNKSAQLLYQMICMAGGHQDITFEEIVEDKEKEYVKK